MKKKKRVLLSAFACDPITGGEPYVGWQWAQFLCQSYDLHVVTRTYNKSRIGNHELAKQVQFHYCDAAFSLRRGHYSRFNRLYYVYWQWLALRRMRRLHRQQPFDLVHHVTYNSVEMPGLLWRLPGAAFVWGPVGGGQLPPDSLSEVYGRAWLKQRLRKFLKLSAKYNPVIRIATRRAAAVLFANADTEALLRDLPIKHGERMLETSIHERTPSRPRNQPGSDRPLRVTWIGHIVPRKALALALNAMASGLRDYGDEFRVELHVLGDGPLLPAARQMVEDLQLTDRVTFHDVIPHAEIDAFFEGADILLFTSVQDTSGNVVLEAMANGVPVVALNHQGVKEMVTMGGGVLVDVCDFSGTVRRLADVLHSFANNRVDYQAMSNAALDEVRERHTWQLKSRKITELYDTLINQG